MSTKKRINLYAHSLLPAKLRLSFQRLYVIAIAVMILGSASVGGSYWLQQQVESELVVLTAQKKQYDTQKKNLEAQIAARVPDKALLQRVELDQQQLNLKKLLLAELQQREAMTSQGYSDLLTELAEVADENVWLERIYVEDQQYLFQGHSKYPNSLPRWIEQLASTHSLRGHAFASMTMKKGESSPLAFTLTSRLDSADKVEELR